MIVKEMGKRQRGVAIMSLCTRRHLRVKARHQAEIVNAKCRGAWSASSIKRRRRHHVNGSKMSNVAAYRSRRKMAHRPLFLMAAISRGEIISAHLAGPASLSAVAGVAALGEHLEMKKS